MWSENDVTAFHKCQIQAIQTAAVEAFVLNVNVQRAPAEPVTFSS